MPYMFCFEKLQVYNSLRLYAMMDDRHKLTHNEIEANSPRFRLDAV
jgi:hypothetical protein